MKMNKKVIGIMGLLGTVSMSFAGETPSSKQGRLCPPSDIQRAVRLRLPETQAGMNFFTWLHSLPEDIVELPDTVRTLEDGVIIQFCPKVLVGDSRGESWTNGAPKAEFILQLEGVASRDLLTVVVSKITQYKHQQGIYKKQEDRIKAAREESKDQSNI
jgi:hypothetical protein